MTADDREPISDTLIAEMASPLRRLVDLRLSLLAEREAAVSPAVSAALATADVYLFLAMSYLGYTDKLFPEER